MPPTNDDSEDGDDRYDLFLRAQARTFTHAVPDPVLSALVSAVNRTDGFRISITLYVNGLVVTGLLVGIREWMNEVAHEIDQQDGEDGEVLSFPLRSIAAEVELEQVDEAHATAEPVHVHIRDARLYLGADVLQDHLWWRGRLNAVDGWTLGRWQ